MVSFNHGCHRTVGTYPKIALSPRPQTLNYSELLKINFVNKSENVHDADFTTRKLLTNSWDAYVAAIIRSSVKMSDKSGFFVDTLISSTLFTQFISNVCERGNKCFGDHNAIFATPPQFDVMFKTRTTVFYQV